MKTAAAVRHVHFEDAGAFESTVGDNGYALRYYDAGLDDLQQPMLRDCDLLIVLGAPIGAYEEDKYPFLRHELALIESRLASARPAVGICLGSQLFARALGSRVYPGPRKEIGWAPIALTDAGKRAPTKHLEGHPVLHWHGDTFDLPAGADLLASTPLYRNQAFAYGRHAIAFQCHPEAQEKGFERWLIGHATEISHVPGLSVQALRADAQCYAGESARRGQQCFSEWLEQLG